MDLDLHGAPQATMMCQPELTSDFRLVNLFVPSGVQWQVSKAEAHQSSKFFIMIEFVTEYISNTFILILVTVQTVHVYIMLFVFGLGNDRPRVPPYTQVYSGINIYKLC